MRRDFKVGIYTSLIGSVLFLIFLQPLLKIFGKIVFAVFSRGYGAYLDRLFSKAALGTAPDPSFFVLAIMTGMFSGTMLALLLRILRKKELNKISDKRKTAKTPPPTSRLGRITMTAFCVCSTILLFHAYWTTWFQARLVTSFEQHMHAISPYISDQEAKVLRSRWTQMKCETDYNGIYMDMRAIAATNNISLPGNIVYSFNNF